jgi:hypothetical protein
MSLFQVCSTMEPEFSMFSTLVFLGPSLPISEAKKILPDAYYLPPVRCGDVLHVLRLKPQVIGIIDGYFENTAAVWHKEILFAIEQGVRVFGSSSMGALRASELASFGMTVVGAIADDYLSAKITDDDEVAILHSPQQSDYYPLTDAMPNIRETLQLAYEHQVIDKLSYDSLLASAKSLFYQQRTLKKIIELAENQLMPQQVAQLKQWLNQTHYQDSKRIDAILLLQTLAADGFKKNQPQFTMNKPAFFRALHRNIMCRPFSSYQDWLPIQEKVALIARFIGSEYKLIRRLAYLLAACHAIAKKSVKPEQQTTNPADFNVKITTSLTVWKQLNDCSDADAFLHRVAGVGWGFFSGGQRLFIKGRFFFFIFFFFFLCFFFFFIFLNRVATLHSLFTQEEQIDDIPGSFKDYLLLLLRQSGDYVRLKTSIKCGIDGAASENDILAILEQQEPNKYQLFKCLAYCWWFIERCALRIGLQPDPHVLQAYSDEFRRENKLSSLNIMQDWLKKNDLDLSAYYYLMAATYRLNFLVLQNNLDILNPDFQTEDTWWLCDALWLSNYYVEAKSLLMDTAKLQQRKQAIVTRANDLEAYLLSLDFSNGEQEFKAVVDIITA